MRWPRAGDTETLDRILVPAVSRAPKHPQRLLDHSNRALPLPFATASFLWRQCLVALADLAVQGPKVVEHTQEEETARHEI